MKSIEFFFFKDLNVFLNQERLDLIQVFLAFEQEVILNIDNLNKSHFDNEIQNSPLIDYLENPNLKLYLRDKEDQLSKSDLLINCAN
tara:strand:+ start:2596 stop:2856 length:261 start_codon:yes stop_codon:yes gene_type:complete